MALEVRGRLLELFVGALDPQFGKELSAGLRREVLEVHAPDGAALELLEVVDGDAGGDHAQARVIDGQLAQQALHAGVAQLSRLLAGRVLQ